MANSFANTHQISETIRQRQAEKRIVSLLFFLAAKDQVVPIFEVLDQARGCHGTLALSQPKWPCEPFALASGISTMPLDLATPELANYFTKCFGRSSTFSQPTCSITC